MCGEKKSQGGIYMPFLGSPPRVRGKASAPCTFWISTGITPACAGKRFRLRQCCRKKQDHPRVCGEKRMTKRTLAWEVGSPPRVRGKVIRWKFKSIQRRITPACAGKSLGRSPAMKSCRDHPRVCGEKGNVELRRSVLKGSPPRVRGKVQFRGKRRELLRITPACAGKR